MDEQRTIRIIGLEGTVNLEDLYMGIYLIMGKPECVRVCYASKNDKDEHDLTAFQQVHFWEDQPTTAFQDSFVDVAAGEVIIAHAWVAKQTALEAYRKAVAPAWEAYLKAEAMALEAREKAFDQAWEACDRVEALTPGSKVMAQKAYEEALAQARETYAEALAQAEKAYEEAKAQAREEYKKARAQAKKEEKPDV